MPLIPKNPDAAALVRRFSMRPHPEGGWYREVHRSTQAVQSQQHGQRAAFTSILFLLEALQVSRLHRLDAEELWNWHAGAPLDVRILADGRGLETRRLGPGLEESFQTVVPPGCWFGAELASPETWSLVGCVVAPGFEFKTFELADRERLLREFPSATDTIRRLT
jgi:uncharacterized protein